MSLSIEAVVESLVELAVQSILEAKLGIEFGHCATVLNEEGTLRFIFKANPPEFLEDRSDPLPQLNVAENSLRAN